MYIDTASRIIIFFPAGIHESQCENRECTRALLSSYIRFKTPVTANKIVVVI